MRKNIAPYPAYLSKNEDFYMNPIRLNPKDEVDCYLCGVRIKDHEADVIFPSSTQMEYACAPCAMEWREKEFGVDG